MQSDRTGRQAPVARGTSGASLQRVGRADHPASLCQGGATRKAGPAPPGRSLPGGLRAEPAWGRRRCCTPAGLSCPWPATSSSAQAPWTARRLRPPPRVDSGSLQADFLLETPRLQPFLAQIDMSGDTTYVNSGWQFIMPRTALMCSRSGAIERLRRCTQLPPAQSRSDRRRTTGTEVATLDVGPRLSAVAATG